MFFNVCQNIYAAIPLHCFPHRGKGWSNLKYSCNSQRSFCKKKKKKKDSARFFFPFPSSFFQIPTTQGTSYQMHRVYERESNSPWVNILGQDGWEGNEETRNLYSTCYLVLLFIYACVLLVLRCSHSTVISSYLAEIVYVFRCQSLVNLSHSSFLVSIFSFFVAVLQIMITVTYCRVIFLLWGYLSVPQNKLSEDWMHLVANTHAYK